MGLEIEQDSKTIQVSQKQYIDEIAEIKISEKNTGIPLGLKEKRELKSLAGQMNWIALHSRPDMSYDVCGTNKSLRKMKADNMKLTFLDLGDIEHAEIICYTDASCGNLRGKASQGGYVIFLRGKNGNHAPLAWQSKKIKRVVKSTLAAVFSNARGRRAQLCN